MKLGYVLVEGVENAGGSVEVRDGFPMVVGGSKAARELGASVWKNRDEVVSYVEARRKVRRVHDMVTDVFGGECVVEKIKYL